MSSVLNAIRGKIGGAPLDAQTISKAIPEIRRTEEIPSFHRILNNILPGLDVTKEIVFLETSDKQCFQLCSKGSLTGIEMFQLKNLVQRAGYTISKTYVAPDEIISAMISSERKALEISKTRGESDSIAMFDELLEFALNERASDIHFERRDTITSIKMRIFGDLQLVRELDNETAENVMRVALTVLGDEGSKPQTFNINEMQQASITRKIAGIAVKLRAQTTPAFTIGGEGQDAVMRVLPMSASGAARATLETLGYTKEQIEILETAKTSPSGATVFAGVTGSGKSTSLDALLRGIIAESEGRKKIFTVEDPAEYLILGSTQIPVQRGLKGQVGNPFANAMRAAMRADPDYIMVGEVRDEESSQLLQRMIMSGHAVLTTVHTSSAIKIPARFADLGIDRSVMSSPDFWVAMVYQKLVQTLCTHCSIPWKEHPSFEDKGLLQRILRVTESDIDGIRANGSGCEHCKGRTISGRTVAAEVIQPDYKMLEFFRSEDEYGMMRYWRGDTGIAKSALGTAVAKMKAGIVSPMELEDAFGKGVYLRGLDI